MTGRLSLPVLMVVVTSVLAVTFLVVLGFRLFSEEPTPGRNESSIARAVEQGRVAAAAEAATLAFLDVDYRDMDATVRGVLDLATGDFHDQYEEASTNLVAATVEGEATSVGEVKYVGLGQVTRSTARAYVAADSTVSNKLIAEAKQKGDEVNDQRYYRFQLDLTLVRGEWLVNDLRFVS